MVNFSSYYLKEAFLSKDLEHAIELIQIELEKKLKTKLYKVDEPEHFSNNVNNNGFGVKFFIGNTDKAIRFDFNNNEIIAVDIWNDESIVPVISIDTKNVNIISILNQIVDKINEPDVEDIMINEEKKIVKVNKISNEKIIDSNEVKNAEKDLEKQKFADPRFVYQDLESLVKLIVDKKRNSLIVAGSAGGGKSFGTVSALKKFGLVEEKDFVIIKGKSTSLGLYSSMYNNNGKIILYDDMDSIWHSEEMINILKAGLDTNRVRQISWISNNTYDVNKFDSEEILELEKKRKYPSYFDFRGRIIFLTNKSIDDLDPAIKDRSLCIDMTMKASDILLRIETILPSIGTDIEGATLEKKQQLLSYFKKLISENKLKKDFSIRYFVISLPIFLSSSPRWKKLIELYS